MMSWSCAGLFRSGLSGLTLNWFHILKPNYVCCFQDLVLLNTFPIKNLKLHHVPCLPLSKGIENLFDISFFDSEVK